MSTKLEVTNEMFNELIARVATLEATIAKQRGTASTREMTDDDAKRVLTGDLKDEPHKSAAEKLGLSYGQVYSCRGEYTFKHVLKALKAEGFKNRWVK
jgi:aldehyde:ferredoxin oxidoreductase